MSTKRPRSPVKRSVKEEQDDELPKSPILKRIKLENQRPEGYIECPYLATVERKVLDFDFEKVCSISLSDQNVYGCLVCGKFFQGRGKKTPLYKHCLEEQHYLFINLETTRVYCLPDEYEVVDTSLRDIQFNLKPRFTREDILKICRGDPKTIHAKSLEGDDFIPGCTGMNLIKDAEHINVAIQLIICMIPFRNHLLEFLPNTGKNKILGIEKLAATSKNAFATGSTFLRRDPSSSNLKDIKIENNDDIKKEEDASGVAGGIASEEKLSSRKPTTRNSSFGGTSSGANAGGGGSSSSSNGVTNNTVPPLGGEIVNTLHAKKTDPVVSSLSEIVKKIFNNLNFKGLVSPHDFYQACYVGSKKQFVGKKTDPINFMSWLFTHLKRKGEKTLAEVLEGEIVTKTSVVSDGETTRTIWTETNNPSWVFQVELPDAPLFKDGFIPEKPFYTLLEKYNNETSFEKISKSGQSRESKKFSIRRLPPYMLFQVKRFQNNNYFIEKNTTIVRFPLQGLEMEPYLHPEALEFNPHTMYNLVALVVHSGKPQEGKYTVEMLHRPTGKWYQVSETRVTEKPAEEIAVSEAYLLLYERTDVTQDGEFTDTKILLDEHIKKSILAAENGIQIRSVQVEDEEMDLEAMGVQIG